MGTPSGDREAAVVKINSLALSSAVLHAAPLLGRRWEDCSRNSKRQKKIVSQVSVIKMNFSLPCF